MSDDDYEFREAAERAEMFEDEMRAEIARLKAELDEAREIIKPFADYRPFEERDEGEISTLTLAHVRRARAFIDKAGK